MAGTGGDSFLAGVFFLALDGADLEAAGSAAASLDVDFNAALAVTGFSLGGAGAAVLSFLSLAAMAEARSRIDFVTSLTVFFSDDLSDFINAFQGKSAG